MSSSLPNLAGVATKDLVEKIGTGKFEKSYISWARTMNLLRTHAPGWLVDYVPTEDGSLLHKAPVGGYLLIRFVNADTGAVTPALPQAIMSHRNDSIPYDKITSRDITDTQRRGMCMAAAMHFGLAYELWAKLPLESGYASSGEDEAIEAPKASVSSTKKVSQEPPTTKAAAEAAKASDEAKKQPASSGGSSKATVADLMAGATEEMFREAALEKGVHTTAIDAIVKLLDGKWASGLKTLEGKTAEELNKKYGQW